MQHFTSGQFKNFLPGRAVPISFIYNASLTPHAATSRVSYTVPAGKTAAVSHATLSLTRSVAATAALNPLAYLELTRSGGSPTKFFELTTGSLNALLGSSQSIMILWMLYPGDKIELFTSDGSTLGTVVYSCNVMIAEI